MQILQTESGSAWKNEELYKIPINIANTTCSVTGTLSLSFTVLGDVSLIFKYSYNTVTTRIHLNETLDVRFCFSHLSIVIFISSL